MCGESFYRSDGKVCSRCDNYVWVLYALAFLLAMVMAPLLFRVAKSQGFMSVNIFVATLQVWACRLVSNSRPPLIACEPLADWKSQSMFGSPR